MSQKESKEESGGSFSLLDQIEVGIVVLDPLQQIKEVNRAVISMTGLSENELKGKKCPDIFHFPRCESPEDCPFRRCLETKSEESGVMFSERLKRWFVISCKPLLDSKGNVERVFHVLTDVTRLKELNEELERNVNEKTSELSALLERYKKFTESPLVGVWETDKNGVVTFVNRTFLKMTGYSYEDVVGKKTILDFTTEEYRRWIVEIMKRTIAGELPPRIMETEVVRKDGSTMHALNAPAGIFDSEGNFKGYMGIMIDITARKNLEETMREVIENLDLFSRSISHELRTPLRTIMGFLDALLKDYSHAIDETHKHYITRVIKAASRMDKLITDLLNYSRISRQKLIMRPVSLKTILEEVIENYRQVITESGATVELDEEMPDVMGDDTFLYNIFSNLLSNALKYVRGRKPHVRIWTEIEGEYVKVFMRDNGIGIDPEYFEKIFHPFERLHSMEEYEGSGIGLAVVKKAAERMNGEVGVESHRGEGSIFWVKLKKAVKKE